ncbi:MAG: DUF115 domain-containing protein [Aliidiomarina sp.]|uniref:6-hydroxymethylpterin diphosphokinase MptE-like protein n=1 Tax=Aliidiomarina sp. TaxID=1872439 RepID=UPI0025C36FB4|nr:6-hydroxymethylpterin diphosphokinase MptE-like protein [Aliidiomarina sp.]MCH8502347.1 DUF115 domain-containing protein [Aliidiomarina sp.]
MSAVKQLEEFLREGKTDSAIEFCKNQLKNNPQMSYYQFWLDRLTKTSRRSDTRSLLPANVESETETSALTIDDAVASFRNAFKDLQYQSNEQYKKIISDQDETSVQREKLVKALPYNGDIYLPTEKIGTSEQIEGLKSVHELITPENKKVTKLRFDQLKNALQKTGKRRIFVIGNGPSLKETDLNLLKDEITIGFNGIFLHESFTPTIFVVEDHLVAEDRIQEITDYQCPVKIFPSYLRYCLPIQENTIFLNHLPRRSFPVDTDFSDDAGTITYTGGTVTYTGLQLAASLGFDEIYLVGVDASYKVENVDRSTDYGTGVLCSKSDDVNHFDSRYFGKGYRWHDPNVNTMLQAYRKVRNYAELNNKIVRNATIGGELEVFPRVNYYDLFDFRRVYPKVAVVDFTHVNWLCATGIVKRNMFSGWSKHSLLHVHAQNPKTISAFQSVPNDCYAAGADSTGAWAALRSVIEYDPDILYLRPTPDRPLLTLLQLALPSLLGKPFVVHYMDDWLSKIEVTIGADTAQIYRRVMEYLFTHAAKVLTISSKMSDYLEKEFSIEKSKLQIVHNYIQNDSQLVLPKNKDVKIIRYFGGIQPDMSLASVIEAARVVEELNKDGEKVRFEIYTAGDHIKKFGTELLAFENTSVFEQHDDYQVYLALLKNSDLNLLCYNFDEVSQRYLRYSMANKLPEIIGAGVPFVAIGSKEIGTISYLLNAGYPMVASENNRRRIYDLFHRALMFPLIQTDDYKQSYTALLLEFSKNKNCDEFQSILRDLGNSDCSEFNYFDSKKSSLIDLLDLYINENLIDSNFSSYINKLLALPIKDRLGYLSDIKSHGHTWQFKDISVDVSTDVSAIPQVELLKFLLVSLNHDRFSEVNTYLFKSFLKLNND